MAGIDVSTFDKYTVAEEPSEGLDLRLDKYQVQRFYVVHAKPDNSSLYLLTGNLY